MPTAFATVLSAVWTGITDLVGVIEADALLLIPIAMAFAAGTIGLAKGLLGTKRRRGR